MTDEDKSSGVVLNRRMDEAPCNNTVGFDTDEIVIVLLTVTDVVPNTAFRTVNDIVREFKERSAGAFVSS